MAATPTEELRERVQKWIQPLSEAAPGGTNAQFDARHEQARTEVAKLDAPSGGVIDWKIVVNTAGEILSETSKDFLMSTYVAYGLYQTNGLDGLVTGLTLLTELIEQYWETAFPELRRIRGRSNALAWFIERVSISLPTTQISSAARQPIEDLVVVGKRFGSAVRDKFADQAPALGPLLENIERLRVSLPPEAPPPPPPPPPPPAGAPAAAPPSAVAAPPVAAAAPAQASAPAAELQAGGDATAYLREVGAALMKAGTAMRQAEVGSALAYRVFRVGLWVYMVDPPPAGPDGKTQIPAPPAALKQKLDTLVANQNWATALDESESGLTTARFALDLNRYSAQALGALGHTKARDGLLTEVAGLLRRMPRLLQMSFADGSPLADAQTKAWIDADVSPAGEGGGGGAPDWLDEIRVEARKLVGSGKVAEAVALIHAKVAIASSGKERFRARLLLAKACVAAGQPALAKAVFESLDQEIAARRIDEWDPELCGECVEGYLSAVRALGKAGKPMPAEAAALYDRLCRLDPAAALRMGA